MDEETGVTSKPPRSALIVDNVHAPDLYADPALSFSMENGVVRITLASKRPLQTGGKMGHVVIARLVMPAEKARAMSGGFSTIFKIMASALVRVTMLDCPNLSYRRAAAAPTQEADIHQENRALMQLDRSPSTDDYELGRVNEHLMLGMAQCECAAILAGKPRFKKRTRRKVR